MNVLFRFTVIPYNQKHILPHKYFSSELFVQTSEK